MTIYPHWPSASVNMNHPAVKKFLFSVKQKETVKLELFNEIRALETKIAALIVQETSTFTSKNPSANKIELMLSQELKNLLLEQANALEKAAIEARREAQLEKAMYEMGKK